jgi:hypothetical protein
MLSMVTRCRRVPLLVRYLEKPPSSCDFHLLILDRSSVWIDGFAARFVMVVLKTEALTSTLANSTSPSVDRNWEAHCVSDLI